MGKLHIRYCGGAEVEVEVGDREEAQRSVDEGHYSQMSPGVESAIFEGEAIVPVPEETVFPAA